MEAGALNKRLEFHNNIICRLRPSTSQDMSENELQKALEKKRVYHSKINKFIDVMSNMNSVIVNRKKMKHTVSNELLCSRSKNGKQQLLTTLIKRKRSDMDSSTPISNRREVVLIGLEDDSPIGGDRSKDSSTYSASEDVVPGEKTKAGMSDEINILAVTPPSEESPNTYERNLALHAGAIAMAAENNQDIPELREEVDQSLDMSCNPFAIKNIQESVGEPVNISEPGASTSGTVGMNGMNKPPIRGGKKSRAAGMNGMNKSSIGGE